MMIHINTMDNIINNEEILNDMILIQRDLKIEMTKENMKSLFDNVNGNDIADYLRNKAQTFTTCFGEGVHLTVIKFLNNEKNNDIGMVYNELNVFYSRYNQIIDNRFFEMIINMIINDYNNYYLNDEFYYCGYWYDGEWIVNSQ